MPYPPDVPTGSRINTTPQVDLHPTDHNEIHSALVDIINVLGSDPAAGFNDVSAALAQLLADALVPAGVALPYFSDSVPSGWVLYQGQMITKASAPQTWARFQDLHGTSTVDDFYLPDARRRVLVGKTAGDVVATWADTIGETGGSEDSVLIEHDHAVNPPQTDLVVPGGFGRWINRKLEGGGGTAVVLNQTNYGGEYTEVKPSVDIAQFTSAKAGATDEDGVEQNLQPYIVVNYIGRLV